MTLYAALSGVRAGGRAVWVLSVRLRLTNVLSMIRLVVDSLTRIHDS